MRKAIVISNCHDCPFSYWSDHAIPPKEAPGYYDRGGEICSMNQDVRLPVVDASSFTKVHELCPLRKNPYVEIYSIAEGK